jgi:hypothetical protein
MTKPICALLLIVVASVACGAQQMDDPDAKSKIMALEQLSKLQAYQASDTKTLDALLDDKFVSVDPDGTLQNKAELLTFVRRADSLRYLTSEMIVRLHNRNTAIVTGLFQMKGVLRGKSLHQSGRFIDTWLFKDGRWVAIASLSMQSNSN